MAHKRLCQATAVLHAAILLHSIVDWVKGRFWFLACVYKACLALAILRFCDVYIVRWVIGLGLIAAFNLEVEEIE